MLLEPEFIKPRESRRIFPCLLHYGQNNTIVDHEQFQVSDVLHCHWSCNVGKLEFCFVSTIT